MVLTDEEQPLLRIISQDAGNDIVHDDSTSDFEPLDPENPKNWSSTFKWSIVLLLALMAFTVYDQFNTKILLL